MANEMSDRLVELIRDYNKGRGRISPENLADYLIADGWIRLPCKVGDTVYFANEYYHDSAEIDGINITKQGIGFTYVQYEYGPDITELWDDGEFSIDEIGKTVFLTREAKEEAEQKLKEMRGDNNA